MAKQYNIAVFIGRFQPFHLGHLSVVTQGLEQADHLVVLVGSSNAPRSHRNPFTFDERRDMIMSSIPSNLRKRVIVKPLEDASYNDTKWVHDVQTLVMRAEWEFGYTNDPTVALIGHSKDASSYYLKMFPQWRSIGVDNFRELDSTQIRNVFFSNIGHMWIGDADGHRAGDLDRDAIITVAVREFLLEFLDTAAYKLIRDEYEFIAKYRASWAVAPYAPTFVTVDAVVVQSGHVLIVRRGAVPGKGLWAMPGGFINADERIRDAVIRELREETGIKVPDKVLRGSIVAQDVFDDPNRSARGRTITHAFLFKLEDGDLPRVRGMDDADKARWIAIGELKRSDFFEDHFDIIQNMIARI
jgi:bifunctional NMN adenylyltransferase/nudix hydrolase